MKAIMFRKNGITLGCVTACRVCVSGKDKKIIPCGTNRFRAA